MKDLLRVAAPSLLFCAGTIVAARAAEASHGSYRGPKDQLHVYLLIGQSSTTEPVWLKDEGDAPLDRCYVLTGKNEWEAAKNLLVSDSTRPPKLGVPELILGYSFAKTMLKANPGVSIGLILNTKDSTSMNDWDAGTKFYREASRRAQVAAATGILKGVLWHQGERTSNHPEGNLDQMMDLIANLRTFLGILELPFIAGQSQPVSAETATIPDQIAKLPERVHASGFVSSRGLPGADHPGSAASGVTLLGQRYAEEMLKVQRRLSQLHANTPKGTATYIDTHVHAPSCKKGGLDEVALGMAKYHVERCIVHPLKIQDGMPRNAQEREIMLDNYRLYKGKIDRFCILFPEDVRSVTEAVEILKREKQDGAIGFGEHYIKRDFDDPKNMLLYEACNEVGLPVMFHGPGNDQQALAALERALVKYPKLIFIAHSTYWWRHLATGDCDRLLQAHPNLYADLSAESCTRNLNRDRNYSEAFMIRNADKLLFGTDTGLGVSENPPSQFTLLEQLNLPADVRVKIYRLNAMKLFGFTKPEMEAADAKVIGHGTEP